MDYKNGKIAQKIIELQNDDGTWGNEFHSLAVPNNRHPLTRLIIIGRRPTIGICILN